MTKRDFDSCCELLQRSDFAIDGSHYSENSFGSWWIAVTRTPRLRIVWDGKDGWVYIQRETDEVFQAVRVWRDLWTGRERRFQVPELVVRKLLDLIADGE